VYIVAFCNERIYDHNEKSSFGFGSDLHRGRPYLSFSVYRLLASGCAKRLIFTLHRHRVLR